MLFANNIHDILWKTESEDIIKTILTSTTVYIYYGRYTYNIVYRGILLYTIYIFFSSFSLPI